METLKIGPAILFEILFKIFEIRKTIPDDDPALLIQAVLAVEKIDNASADDRIQGHQRSFVLAGHSRPAVLFMGFP
jgi:hypothetical protein